MKTDNNTSNIIEEGNQLLLRFNKLTALTKLRTDLLPVIVQDVNSLEVLLLAYTNQAALKESIKTRQAVFWSSSRNELWIKGAISGNYLDLVEIRINCEQNSLLYLVTKHAGGACHTKDAKGMYRTNCFYRRLSNDQLEFI